MNFVMNKVMNGLNQLAIVITKQFDQFDNNKLC